jgi:uncharacterized protein YndB with AHSA1/START domain
MTEPTVELDTLETIEHVVRIDARPETVWSFWTEPERLCEWWGVEADAVTEAGGLFRVVMEGGPVMRGEFLELEPPRRLVFSFGWEGGAPGGPMPPGTSRVEVTLEPDASATLLTLRHELPASHAADHRKGWTYFIDDRMATLAARLTD